MLYEADDTRPASTLMMLMKVNEKYIINIMSGRGCKVDEETEPTGSKYLCIHLRLAPADPTEGV
jgi:hypothetical protein